jgi:hypothetical protein
MNKLMVVGAEVHEVSDLGRPAASPVFDVMRVQMSRVCASGEAAALIAAAKCPSQRRRYRAGAPSDRQRLAAALDDCNDPRVAAQPPQGFRRHRRSAGQLALTADLVCRQRPGVHMHHNLCL